MTWIEHPQGRIAVAELPNGRRRVAVHPRPGVFVSRQECVTAYPLELIRRIAEAKAPGYVCDEIARDEDPNYVELFLRYSLAGYLAAEAFREARILDFGSGGGASTVVLARMFPDARIVGVELEPDLIAIARLRAEHHMLSNVRFLASPDAESLPADLGTFGFINLSAVYEHLLPEERPRLLSQLWSALEVGGVIFVNQLPYRFYPIEAHTTGLPLINFLPDRLAHLAATRFSPRITPDATWRELLRRGIRGGTGRSVRGDLLRGGGDARTLRPTMMGLRDHADLWYAYSSRVRAHRLKRLMRVAFRAASRVTGDPVAPGLSLAFQKGAQPPAEAHPLAAEIPRSRERLPPLSTDTSETMWKAAATWSRPRLRARLLATLPIAIGLLAPVAAAGQMLSDARVPLAPPSAPAAPRPEAPQRPRDSRPPSAPTALTTTASTPTSVTLSWAASTDNVGVAGYGLYLNGARVSRTTGTSFVFRSLDCGTSPRLGVDAFDAAGNRSGRTEASASTQPCATPSPSCDKVASPGEGSAQALLASLSSGQVGCLRGGTYTAAGLYVLDFSAPDVTITSYPGEKAVLVGVIVARSGASRSRLAGVAVEGTGGWTGQTNTIQILATSDFVLEDSDITNSWLGRSCLIIGNGAAEVAVRPVIRRNRFHECGNPANSNLDHAIYAADVVDARITDNLFWNTAAYAVHLYPNAQRSVIAHNVIDGGSGSVAGGVIFAGDSGAASSGNVVEYNVIGYSTRYNIESWWGGPVGSGNVARANCVFGGGLGDIGPATGFAPQSNLPADPLFFGRAGHDYRLRPDSPCLALVGYDTAGRLG